MNISLKAIAESSITAILVKLLVCLIGMLPAVLLFLLSEKTISLINAKQWAILALTGISVIIFLTAYILALKKQLSIKPNMINYKYLEDPPIYVHLKDQTFHCYKCLFVEGHEKSILGAIWDSDLRCANCEKSYMSYQEYLGFRAKVNRQLFPNKNHILPESSPKG